MVVRVGIGRCGRGGGLRRRLAGCLGGRVTPVTRVTRVTRVTGVTGRSGGAHRLVAAQHLRDLGQGSALRRRARWMIASDPGEGGRAAHAGPESGSQQKSP